MFAEDGGNPCFGDAVAGADLLARKLLSHVSQVILPDYRATPASVMYPALNQARLDGSQPYIVRCVIRAGDEYQSLSVDMAPTSLQS